MPPGMTDELLLAIETSGDLGGVALAQGARLLASRHLSADRRHTAELLPTIRDLLAAQARRLPDVALFAYSSGPGSFTGLRVAATVGRTMQSVTGCRVVAVPTLEVIARNALSCPDAPPRIVALLDAGRGQVYGAAFERVDSVVGGPPGDDLRPVVSAGLFKPDALLARVARPFCILGPGVRQHAAACAASGGIVLDAACWPPSVEQVALLGWRLACAGRVCRPHEILPLYIRPPECEEVYEQRRAAARRKRGE